MIVAAWICLVAPLAAALLITLLGTGISRRTAAYLATTSVLGAFAAAVVVFAKLWGESPDARSHPSTVWEWLTAGSFHVGLRILVDPLSVFMMLVVSGVGFLIVAYSIAYMDGDDEERRYFAYMALFVFSMLMLVQAGNLLLLLVGWGLVGLSSYLLIGFWHHRPQAVAAAKKAFIMNAFGDATFALALFELAPVVQDLAAGLGAATIILAGLIAIVQVDIKRVIAYSTMSQIGYMFLGAGIGAYGSAMFHLMTHAFFKALLFMAAGIVIHHLDGEQDMRKMGGLKQVLPRTRLAFLVGTLALVGIPPLAGFWSKDAILASALDLGGGLGWTLYVAGLAGTLLTGAYAFRLYYAMFHGPEAEPAHGAGAAHATGHGEGPLSMLVPVGILTVLSAVGG